jgi:AraC-like DNA-binding protein
MFSSLVLGFLLVRLWLFGRGHGPLVLLLALCAAQGVVMSLAQHYLVPGTMVVQALGATMIPPMAWVAFQATAVRAFRPADLLHFIWPFVTATCILTQPDILDALIPGLFVVYGGIILHLALKGPDALPRMRLEAGDLPGRIWLVIGASLIGSALSDVLIVAADWADADHLRPWIISIYSSVMLLVVGVLSLSGALTQETPDPNAPPVPVISEHDTQIVARLEELVHGQKLYLNPDLTLSQLARKLLVPVKQLSGAINRVTGENVSRFINKARVATAQEALLKGDNVTTAMFSAGFNTKSNFNREFLRVVGKSPSEWLEAQR